MQKKKSDRSLCDVHGTTINGIYFTPKEIDILACLLSGRTSKAIASVLKIAVCTVETHIRNIMLKIKCNSRESIRDFLEGAPQTHLLRQRYSILSGAHHNEKQRYDVSSLIDEKSPVFCMVYDQDNENEFSLMHSLELSLNPLGIKTIIISRQKHPFLAQIIETIEA